MLNIKSPLTAKLIYSDTAKASVVSPLKPPYHEFFTGLPNPVGICVLFVDFVIIIIFAVSVKVFPVTSLLSGVFVHRAFCAYFVRIERVVGNA